MTTARVRGAHRTMDVQALLLDYFDAGLCQDLDRMKRLYAIDFVNVRVDLAGRVATITRDQMLHALRARAAQGAALPPVDDVEILTTTSYGTTSTITFRRVKHGQPLIYAFTWDLAVDPPVLAQEITTMAAGDRLTSDG
jgi:hypothetical protein